MLKDISKLILLGSRYSLTPQSKKSGIQSFLEGIQLSLSVLDTQQCLITISTLAMVASSLANGAIAPQRLLTPSDRCMRAIVEHLENNSTVTHYSERTAPSAINSASISECPSETAISSGVCPS